MSLVLKILHIYPTLDPRLDFKVFDDGNGEYIKEWNNANQLPTQAEIEAATLPALKLEKENEITAAHGIYVMRGFASNALGSTHTYFTNDAYHWVNTLGAGIRGIARKFECKDANGVSNNPMHTFLQLQTVLSDGDNFLQSAYDRKWDLINAARAIGINATYPTLADAEAAINAIVWTDTW